MRWGCVWVRAWSAGVACGPAGGDLQVRSPQWLVGRPLDGVQNTIRRICSEPWLLFSQLLNTPTPVKQLTTHYSGWGERDMGIFGSLPHSWGSWMLTHTSDFLWWEKSWAEKGSLVLGCAALGEGWCGKGKLFLLPSSRGPFLEFSAPTFPLGFWTSTKARLSGGDCLSYYSPGAPRPWRRGAGGSLQALRVHRVCLLITWCTDGQDSWGLDVWCWW